MELKPALRSQQFFSAFPIYFQFHLNFELGNVNTIYNLGMKLGP